MIVRADMKSENIIEYIFSPDSLTDSETFTPYFITQLLDEDPTLGLMLLTYLLEENKYDQDDGRIADKLVGLVREGKTPDTLENLSPIGDDEITVLLCLIELNPRDHALDLIPELKEKYRGVNHAVLRLKIVEYLLHNHLDSDNDEPAPDPWNTLRDQPLDILHDLLIQEEVRYAVETRYLEELEELMHGNNRNYSFENYKENLDLLTYNGNRSISEDRLNDSAKAFSITLAQAYFTISDRFKDDPTQIDCLEKARQLLDISYEQAVDNPDTDFLSIAALTNSKFEELPWESITMQQVTSLINYIDTLLDGGVE